MLDTAREPIAVTVPACASAGRTPSVSSARSSCRSSSGLPEVVRWQAATNRGSAPSPSRAPHEVGDALGAQRAGPHGRGRRVELQLRDQRVVVELLPGAQGRHQQHRQPVEPAHQVREEAQRTGVAPLQVVHHDASAGRVAATFAVSQ